MAAQALVVVCFVVALCAAQEYSCTYGPYDLSGMYRAPSEPDYSYGLSDEMFLINVCGDVHHSHCSTDVSVGVCDEVSAASFSCGRASEGQFFDYPNPDVEGVQLVYPNGDLCNGVPRTTNINIRCDPSAPGSGFVYDMDETIQCRYTVAMSSKHACRGATTGVVSSWSAARGSPAARNAIDDLWQETPKIDLHDEDQSWEYNFGTGWAWSNAHASFWAANHSVVYHAAVLRNTTSGEGTLFVLNEEDVTAVWMSALPNITMTPEGETYSVQPGIVVVDEAVVVCGASSTRSSSSVCSAWDVPSQQLISSITFQGANISTPVVRDAIYVLVDTKEFRLQLTESGLVIEDVKKVEIGGAPQKWGETTSGRNIDGIFASAYYEDAGWVGHLVVADTVFGKIALNSESSFAVLTNRYLVVATQFLQGCVEVFDLKEDDSYIECLPALAEQVTDVACDDLNDFIFAFSSGGVMCLHAHSSISRFHWFRKIEEQKSSSHVGPCVGAFLGRDAVVMVLSGNTIMALDADDGVSHWHHELDSDMKVVGMWCGHNAVMVESEEGQGSKLYSIGVE